jgi:hypothetical protein
MSVDELLDHEGRLRANFDPVIIAVFFQCDLGRAAVGVVKTEMLDETPVSRKPVVRNNDPVDGVLLAAFARQSNSNRHIFSLLPDGNNKYAYNYYQKRLDVKHGYVKIEPTSRPILRSKLGFNAIEFQIFPIKCGSAMPDGPAANPWRS